MDTHFTAAEGVSQLSQRPIPSRLASNEGSEFIAKEGKFVTALKHEPDHGKAPNRRAHLVAPLLVAVALAGQLPSLFGEPVESLIHDVSAMADGSDIQARIEAQRQVLSGNLPYRSYDRKDFTSFTGKYTPPELSDDKNGRFVYGLALLSDDGSTVSVGGTQIHDRKREPQHLPDLDESFHVLEVALAPGEPVDIAVVITSSTTLTPEVPDTPTSTAAPFFFTSFLRGWQSMPTEMEQSSFPELPGT